MKAAHLRIGNLIYSIDEDFNRELIIVDANDICNVDCEDDNDGYEPIPLTAEWLGRFGFDRDYDSDSGWRKNILREWVYLYCDTQGYFEISVSKHSCPVKIKQVHQLQNLFFALTGEELHIKK